MRSKIFSLAMMNLRDNRSGGRSWHVVLLLAAACTLAFAALDGPRAAGDWFWFDEIITADLTHQDVGAIVRDRYAQAHGPLYYLLAKWWVLVAAGSASPGELLLRLPSMIAMGLAGGLLGAAAWRSWGVAAGILFCFLWTLHPLIAYYAIEARPYALMILFLAVGIWSSVCLTTAGEDSSFERPGRLTRIASIAAPLLASATIPLGAVAAALVEGATISAIYRHQHAVLRAFWWRRIIAVWPAVAALMLVFAPAIMRRSVNYWTEELAPLSLYQLERVAGGILGACGLPNFPPWTPWAASGLVIIVAAAGSIRRAPTVLGRAALFLALLFPVLMIAASTVTSLLIPRYFLPTVPGVLLLAAAGATALPNRWLSATASIALCISLGAALSCSSWPFGRPPTVEAEVRFLQTLGISSVTGAVSQKTTTKFGLRRGLNYYLHAHQISANVELLVAPIARNSIPDGGVFWVFDWPPLQAVEELIGDDGLTVCAFDVGRGRIYAAARSAADLPGAVRKMMADETAVCTNGGRRARYAPLSR